MSCSENTLPQAFKPAIEVINKSSSSFNYTITLTHIFSLLLSISHLGYYKWLHNLIAHLFSTKMFLSFFDKNVLKSMTTTPNDHLEVEQHPEVELFPASLLSEVTGPVEKECKRQKFIKSDSPSITAVHENDVLMGRGGKNNQHIGNENLRQLARQESENYRRSSKKGKSYISRVLVMKIRELDPPGRFLKRNRLTSEWEDVGDEIAREKASQVLRDAVSGHTIDAYLEENVRHPDLEHIQLDPEEKLRPQLFASERVSDSTTEFISSSIFQSDLAKITAISGRHDCPQLSSTPILIGKDNVATTARSNPHVTPPEDLKCTATPSKNLPQPGNRPSCPPVTSKFALPNKKRRIHISHSDSFSFDRNISSSMKSSYTPGTASRLGAADSLSGHHPQYCQYNSSCSGDHKHQHQQCYQSHQQHGHQQLCQQYQQQNQYKPPIQQQEQQQQQNSQSASSHELLGEIHNDISDMQENIDEFDLFNGELLEETSIEEARRESMENCKGDF